MLSPPQSIPLRRRLAIAALVALAALAAAWLWNGYREGRKASLEVATDEGIHAVVEIEREGSGEHVAAFSAPTREPFKLEPGDYRIWVTPEHRIGRSFPYRALPGTRETIQTGTPPEPLFEIRLSKLDRMYQMWGLATTLPAASGRGLDLFLVRGELRKRFEGSSGKALWNSAPDRAVGFSMDNPFGPPFGMDRMPRPEDFGATPRDDDALRRAARLRQLAPHLDLLPVPRPVDLDGDRAADACWSDEASKRIFAMSGKGSKEMLWTFLSTSAPLGKDRPPLGVTGTLAFEVGGGESLVVAAFEPDRVAGAANPPTGFVQAIAGKTGRPLWSFTPPATPEAPRAGVVLIDHVRRGGKEVIAVTDDDRIHVLDPKTGHPTEPAITFPEPFQGYPIFAAAADGSREEVLVYAGSGTLHYRARTKSGQSVSWQSPAAMPGYSGGSPRLVDLDGDGASEVVTPAEIAPTPGRPAAVRLEALDAQTGRVRWNVPLTPNGVTSNVPFSALTDLDIDGDGTRDPVVHVYHESPFDSTDLLVAFSGKDGSTLWVAHLPGRLGGDPVAWGRGPDGGPMIVAPVSFRDERRERQTLLLDARTGRECARVGDAYLFRTDDLDGDGRPELWGPTRDGYLALKDHPLPAWWRPGDWRVAPDLDRDGLADFYAIERDSPPASLGPGGRLDLNPSVRYNIIAASGRDGRTLWDATAPRVRNQQIWGPPSVAPTRDLDGDGVDDLLVHAEPEYHIIPPPEYRSRLPVSAISGRDGRILWGPRPRVGPPISYDLEGTLAADLDGDGRTDLAVLARESSPTGFNAPASPAATQVNLLGLTLYRGRDGVPMSRTLLSPDGHRPQKARIVDQARPVDLDGDRGNDVLIELDWGTEGPKDETGRRVVCELVGVSGRTGSILFRLPAQAPPSFHPEGIPSPPTTHLADDLDGDGRAEVIVAEKAQTSPSLRVRAYDTRSHSDRWIWESDPKEFVVAEVMTIARAPGTPGRDVIVRVVAGNQSSWTWLDPSGKVLGTKPNPTADAGYAGDFDGDGREEFLSRSHQSWPLSRDGFRETVRTIPTMDSVAHDPIEVLRSPNGKRAALYRIQSDVFDLADGRRIAASPNARSMIDPGRGLLLPDDPGERPTQIAREVSGVGVIALPPVIGDAASRPGASPPAGPPVEDPRFLYPPPWAGYALPFPTQPHALLRAALITLVALLPLGLFVGLEWLRRRRWPGRRSGVLPLMLAVALSGLAFWEVAQIADWIEYEDEIFSGYVRMWGRPRTALAVLALGLPLVAIACRLGSLVVRGRLLRLIPWLLLIASASALAAFVLIKRLPPPPGLQYRRTPLENLLGLGLVIAGGVSLLGSLCVHAYRTLRRMRSLFRPQIGHVDSGQLP